MPVAAVLDLRVDGGAVLARPTPRPVARGTAACAAEVDLPSFDEIYAAHAAFVWRIVRTFGVPDAQLEDAVQDVFVVVHRKLAGWEGRAAMTTWLFAIARRIASGYRRKGRLADGTARTEALAAEPGIAAGGGTDPFLAFARAEAAATVFAILETLDEDKRVVLALVELEQLSVPDVARVVGCNLNTAYSRLRLARAAFEAAVRARGFR